GLPAEATALEGLLQQHRRLVWRGRALEGHLRDEKDELAARKALERVPEALRALDRIERLRRFREAGNRGEVGICAERDDELVEAQRDLVGRDATLRELDREHARLHEANSRIEQRRSRPRDVFVLPVAERHPGLPSTDVEVGGPVDDDDLVLRREQPAQS